jgi:hypothetical protein
MASKWLYLVFQSAGVNSEDKCTRVCGSFREEVPVHTRTILSNAELLRYRSVAFVRSRPCEVALRWRSIRRCCKHARA